MLLTHYRSPTATPEVFSLKPVARQVLRVSRVAQAVHEYLGATFDDEHLGLCVCGVFSYFAGFTSSHAGQGCAMSLAWHFVVGLFAWSLAHTLLNIIHRASIDTHLLCCSKGMHRIDGGVIADACSCRKSIRTTHQNTHIIHGWQ